MIIGLLLLLLLLIEIMMIMIIMIMLLLGARDLLTPGPRGRPHL